MTSEDPSGRKQSLNGAVRRRTRAGAVALRAGFDDFRAHLSRADALLGLSLLAVVAGLLTGAVIVAFRLVTEWSLVLAGLMQDAERFETLAWEWRLALPIAGGLAIGLLFRMFEVGARQVGPVHVMAQLASDGGRMPWRNAVLQFFGGAASIVCGHSVGREGPVIHVGAASASLLGQWMRLPNNSIRTLVACGVAGAIAASFNTPIAGVVFAMEVVMLEYTLLGFAPVILAAVAAAAVSRLVYGPDPAFDVPELQLVSLLELPWVVLLGAVIGTMAAAYVAGVRKLDERFRHRPLVLRTTVAGIFCAMFALPAPEIMGLGYDTVQLTLVGGIGLASLVLIALAKLGATIVCGGLGLPGGSIGPMIVMGATAGGALGIVGHAIMPDVSAAPAFYAALGAVAMMGASLQAPLAALMAILELTANPNTMLPGMVAVITALLVTRVAFRQDPMFVAILRSRALEFRFDPLAQALERTGVRAVMNRRFRIVDRKADAAALDRALIGRPDWLVVTDGERVIGVLAATTLGALPDEAHTRASEGCTESIPEPPSPVLPERFPAFATVALHATLRQARAALEHGRAEVVLVCGEAARRDQVCGVIGREEIESGARQGF